MPSKYWCKYDKSKIEEARVLRKTAKWTWRKIAQHVDIPESVIRYQVGKMMIPRCKQVNA